MPIIKDIDDDGELNNKYRHKKGNAKNHGLICFLTFEEYANLARQAGIKSSNIGRGGYHLARYRDRGNYEIGNCRFIPYQENMDERKPLDPDRIREGLKRYYAENPGSFTGLSHSEETKISIGTANRIAQAGGRNSQFGTCWITDGSANKKIKRTDKMPAGWRHGRAGKNVN